MVKTLFLFKFKSKGRCISEKLWYNKSMATHKGKRIGKIIAVTLIVFFLALAIVITGYMMAARKVYFINKVDNENFQKSNLEYLKNTFYNGYTPKDEQSICAFDLQKALDEGVRYNQVAFLATHNSCQRLNRPESEEYLRALDYVSFGLASGDFFDKKNFEYDTLTGQLEHGIRSIEFDVEAKVSKGDISFKVMHDLVVDSATSCLDLEGALEEVVTWSNHNPNHLPITILVESKAYVLPVEGFQVFGSRHVKAFDEVLRKCLGDKLFTPSDMLGDYATFEEMRKANDWKPLKEMLGKVVVVLHEAGFVKKYIKQDPTMRTQAMIPSVLYEDRNTPQAGFIIENKPQDAVERIDFYRTANFMVRTRADKYPHFSEERYALANQCLSQIITTDYAPRDLRPEQHTFSFDGFTVKLISF